LLIQQPRAESGVHGIRSEGDHYIFGKICVRIYGEDKMKQVNREVLK